MSTNLFSEAVPPHADSAEPRGIIAALVATFLLAVRNYLKRKAAARSEAISKDEFFTAMLAINDRIHADHLALVEKLDANHRELLAALERQATRINAVESGLARVDERTSQGGRASP
jgi:hypothetical protein